MVGFSHGLLAENAAENEAPVVRIGGWRGAWARVDLGDTRPFPSVRLRRLYALLSGTGTGSCLVMLIPVPTIVKFCGIVWFGSTFKILRDGSSK
jgi:hypothetical protein